MLHGHLNGLFQAFVVLALHLQLVYHHFDIVVFVAVYLHAAGNLHYLAINAHVQVTLASHALEQFSVVPFSLVHQWRENVDALVGIAFQNHLYHLFLGVLHHFLACGIAICSAGTGIKQSQIVVNLCCCAYGRAWVFVGCFLVDADNRAQACYLVHVGAFHSAQKIACVGGERLHVTTLTFGKDGVEGQRRLARTRQSGDDRKAIARYFHIYVFEIVHPRAPHIYLFVLHFVVLLLLMLGGVLFCLSPLAGPCLRGTLFYIAS